MEEIQDSETSKIIEQTDASEEQEIQEEDIQDDISEHEENLPISFDNLKWYEKIKIRIIELFNRIFKRSKSKENQEGNVL